MNTGMSMRITSRVVAPLIILATALYMAFAATHRTDATTGALTTANDAKAAALASRPLPGHSGIKTVVAPKQIEP